MKSTQSDPFNTLQVGEQSNKQAALMEDAAIKVSISKRMGIFRRDISV